MGTSENERITRYLEQLRAGNHDNEARLVELILPELRAQARGALRRWPDQRSMQATELVHEAYLRCRENGKAWENRRHFFAVAGEAMRHILVDYGRKRNAEKRGGGLQRVEMPDVLASPTVDADQILLVAELLDGMMEFNPSGVRAAEMFFYGGLTVDEIAEEMGCSPKTVRRKLDMVCGYCERELSRKPSIPSETRTSTGGWASSAATAEG